MLVLVLVLGLLAIVFAEHVPNWLDAVMERLVGVMLLALGFYVVYSLVRHGRDSRMRSRWMLVAAAAGSGIRWVRRRGRADRQSVVIEHDHGAPSVGEVDGDAGLDLERHVL